VRRHWYEREHPRQPAGAPGGHGGEFRRRVTQPWLQALAGFNAGRMTYEQVLSYVDREDFVSEPMRGGASGGARLREYADGTRLVAKTLQWNDHALNEIEVSLIGRAIGAPVPTVVPDSIEDDQVLMEYIVGDTAVRRLSGFSGSQYWEERAKLTTQYARTDPGILLGLLDLITGQGDRNAGNWIITPFGMPVGIDHTAAFDPDSFDPELLEPPYHDSGFAREIFTEQVVGGRRYTDNPMHPEDIDLAIKRIDQLLDDGLIRQSTHALTTGVLMQARRHAKGTTRRIR